MRLNSLAVIPSEARNLSYAFIRGRRTRIVLTLILLPLVCAISANAQEPVPLARGNTPGEPHHRLKLENEYVRVYYVEVPPHENTQFHQHDNDYIYVSLGPADVVNAILNKPGIHLQLKDGETHFTRGGFAHVARNLADTPFRNITIELLKPQGEAHNLCAQVVLGPAVGKCEEIIDKNVPQERAWKQFETSELTLRLVRIAARSEMFAMATQLPSLLVALDGAQIQIEKYGKPTQSLISGDLIWFEERSVSVVRNLSKEPSRYLWLTFKD